MPYPNPNTQVLTLKQPFKLVGSSSVGPHKAAGDPTSIVEYSYSPTPWI